ncbi:MAG: glycoside hydrolase family 2 TIM barrel-domain containing protein [Bacteroides sp.]|nr:glycoside hydrolase family 2 TIM barrel-domain containing protein [Bacteroides sp.]
MIRSQIGGYNPYSLLFRALIPLIALASCQSEPQRYEKDLSNLRWSIWIDSIASWEEDSLFLPPVDLEELKVNPPEKGWDHLENSRLQQCTLPATVEQYFWDSSRDTAFGAGDFTGVAWFTTSIFVPNELEGKSVFLDFESVRLRAEIYVNQKLAGYDCIGNTPFRAEISKQLNYGSENQLAIRITDPGGNFYWEDYHLDSWGESYIPPSHGFAGITGKVRLLATDPSFIEDVYIQNQADINSIRIQTTLENLHPESQTGTLSYSIWEPGQKRKAEKIILSSINLQAGSNIADTLISISNHIPWSPDSPNLYLMDICWESDKGDADRISKRFGLRWFEARKEHGETSFYLNNKRIFLTSAISWGFWPENGIFPTPDLAKKQVRNLKTLGLNMFNFHRAIGQTSLFEEADSQGILVFEEPGGYRCPTEKIWFWKPEDDPSNSINISEAELAWQWRREKLLRMIKRDRSHPSLVIYNMGNEMLMDPDEQHHQDMAMAHQLDPSRYITFSSHSFHPVFFPEYPEGDCPRDTALAKLFMKPFDHNFHYFGWWDNHHALGEGTYRDRYYNGPTDYNLYSDNADEIVFYGEEGAIHAPQGLDSIIPYLNERGIKGWDSDYLRLSHTRLNNYLIDKGFVDAGLKLESLLTSFANNSYYYHGKMIENCRIGNHVDAYVINGLEDPKRSFCSGILDIYRNIKGDPGMLSAYMEPLYPAIKVYHKILGPGDRPECDIFLVNEDILQGDYLMEVSLIQDGYTIDHQEMKVKISGNGAFGELLVEHLSFPPLEKPAGGYITLFATLSKNSRVLSTGEEKLYQLPEVAIPQGLELMYEGAGAGSSTRSELEKIGIKLLPFSPDQAEQSLLVLTHLPDKKLSETIYQWVNEGNILLVLEEAAHWAEFLDQKGALEFAGIIQNDTEWSAGGAFNRPHPVFQDLPSRGVMGWEYQDLTNDCTKRHSLELEGENAIVGSLGGEQDQVGTAMAELTVGKGLVLLNTLNMEGSLQKNNSASKMTSTLLRNMVLHYSKQEK